MNLDTRPGYAGVDNPLYSSSKAQLFLGDAKESLDRLITAFDSDGVKDSCGVAGLESAKSSDEAYLDAVRRAKKVIIVPGYGMALSQAQFKVRSLIENLETNGCEVKLAIHPVAGECPVI